MRLNVLSFGVLMLVAAGSAQAACPTGDLAGLKAAVDQTLSAVANQDSDNVLNQFSPEGVTFGVDGPVTPHADLVQDFARHGSYYCALFICDGKGGSLRPLFSRAYNAELFSDGGEVSGLADFANLELDYTYTSRCRWELISAVYS